MPRFLLILGVLFGVVFGVAPSAIRPAIAAPVCTGYQPVAGDTLWDLAESRLGNPFRWTEIWAQNPQIHQPGRQYIDSVGRTIVLVYPSDCLAGVDTNVPSTTSPAGVLNGLFAFAAGGTLGIILGILIALGLYELFVRRELSAQ